MARTVNERQAALRVTLWAARTYWYLDRYTIEELVQDLPNLYKIVDRMIHGQDALDIPIEKSPSANGAN